MFLMVMVNETGAPRCALDGFAPAVRPISSSVHGPLAAGSGSVYGVGVGVGGVVVGGGVAMKGCRIVVVGVAVACGLSAPDEDVPPHAYTTMSVMIAKPTSTTARRRQ
jgi:hypothetical protein